MIYVNKVLYLFNRFKHYKTWNIFYMWCFFEILETSVFLPKLIIDN